MSDGRLSDLAQIDNNIKWLHKKVPTGDYDLPPGNSIIEGRSVLEPGTLAEEQKTDLFSSPLTLLTFSPALTVAALCGVLINKTNLKGASAALGYMCAAGAGYISLQLTDSLFNSYRKNLPEPVPEGLFQRNEPRHRSF